jgi:hypothetical protein
VGGWIKKWFQKAIKSTLVVFLELSVDMMILSVSELEKDPTFSMRTWNQHLEHFGI